MEIIKLDVIGLKPIDERIDEEGNYFRAGPVTFLTKRVVGRVDLKPTSRMIQAGNDMASCLMDASIKKALEDVTETHAYDKFHKNIDLINLYLEEEIDSVTAIYISMERERLKELNDKASKQN